MRAYEEAVAEEFAQWRAGANAQPPVQSLFQRIVAFFRGLFGAMRDRATKPEAQEVFERVESGEVGARRQRADRRTEGERAARQPTAEPFTDGVTLSDPERQAQLEEGRKGVRGQQAPLVQRVKEMMAHFGSLWVRSHRNLPREERFADAHAYLRKVTAAPSVATEEIVRYLNDLVKGLSRTDLEYVTFKVMVDDFQYDAAKGMEIPFFGMDVEAFLHEKARIDATMNQRPDLMARVHKRRRYVSKMKDRMVAAGVLTEAQASNPMYFRHQVLEYAALDRPGLGGGRPKRLRKPHIYTRRGTDMIINARLVEVEAEWMFRALTGSINLEQIDAIEKRYDTSVNWDREIREHNNEQMDKLLAAEFAAANENDDVSGLKSFASIKSHMAAMKEAGGAAYDAMLKKMPMFDQLAEYRVSIARGLDSIKRDNELDPDKFPKHIRTAFEKMADENGIDFHVISWIAQNTDGKASIGAASVLKATSARRQFVRDAVGKEYLVPGEYERALKQFGATDTLAVWQPDPGSVFFLAKTVPDAVVEFFEARLAENLGTMQETWTDEELQWALEALRDQNGKLVRGGRKPQMVLPKELAATLDDLGGRVEEGPLMSMAMRLTRLHKQWLLISPRTWFRYNLQNMTGDFDGALAAFPSTLNMKKYMSPAIAELWQVQIKRGKPSAAYLEAAERGVFDAGWSLNEAYEAEGNLGDLMARTDRGLPEQGLRRIWRFFSRSTTFRENWLRYAMYMAVKDAIEAKTEAHPDLKNIMPLVGYGAAKAKIVDATTDPRDRAALIARESIGDYGDISVAGDYLRKRFLWFWSWQEINFKRYMRIGENIILTTKGFGQAKALSKVGARVGSRLALWMTIRASLFFTVVQLWNHLMFPDEEDELGREDKLRLHIILGRDPDGKIVQLRAPGALSDFLGWLGYEDIMSYFSEVEKGRGDAAELAKSVALAPINRVVGGLTPIIKAPFEAASGYTFYPKFYEPRTVRDPWRHAWRTFRLEHEYDAILGRPTRGYPDSWLHAFASRRDPDENAYNYIRSMAYDWQRTVKGRDFRSQAFDDRSRAAYYFRKAVRYQDDAAKRYWRKELAELGVDGKGYRRIVASLHPLSAIAKKDRPWFMSSLTTSEKKRYRRAFEHYKTMFGNR